MNFKNQIYTPGDNDIGGEGYDLVTKKKLERYNEAFGSDELVHTVCPWLGRKVFRIEAISFDSFVCAGVGGGEGTSSEGGSFLPRVSPQKCFWKVG